MLKGVDVVTTNVPGAPLPIYLAGARLQANLGYGPLSGAACNITLLSYIDELHLGISTDPAAVPDPEVFVGCLQDGIAEIEKLGQHLTAATLRRASLPRLPPYTDAIADTRWLQ